MNAAEADVDKAAASRYGADDAPPTRTTASSIAVSSRTTTSTTTTTTNAFRDVEWTYRTAIVVPPSPSSSDGDDDDEDDKDDHDIDDGRAAPSPPSVAPATTTTAAHALSRRVRRKRERQIAAARASGVSPFADVIDFHDLARTTDAHVRARVELVPRTHPDADGLPACARVWRITTHPGLHIVTRALTCDEQVRWAHTALADYSRREHTNLTNLYGAQPDHYAAALANGDFAGLDKLRWVSLGYHYNWTLRSYTPDDRGPFPDELGALAQRIASVVGLDVVPEAAIVNYYPVGGVMGAHRDDAELTVSHPIVSMSIGQPAIFLMGHETRETPPTAMWLCSGDVMIMGGESRCCYHSVARVGGRHPARPTAHGKRSRRKAANTDSNADEQQQQQNVDNEPDLFGVLQQSLRHESDVESEAQAAVAHALPPSLASLPLAERRMLSTYLQHHRINLNVRQVEDGEHTFANALRMRVQAEVANPPPVAVAPSSSSSVTS